MKDYGFIEENVKNNEYGNEYYKRQNEISKGQLKRGIIDINELMNFCRNNNISDFLKYLINSKSKIIQQILIKELMKDVHRSNINHKDYYEQTILMIVGGNINYNIKIKILIENGADGNIEDNKNWPILMDASHYSINLEKIKTIN
ncbi:hypothetical protein H8356DRAFT_1331711 [Neocallimastix lanati (nom. inval.)]|nr:hypothetical protein H8356DRAFT_1331711 [Neocallimastix sp. JGI-2020a]